MWSVFGIFRLGQSGDLSAIGADVLYRGPVAVDIAVAHGSHRAKFHRNRHADILSDGKETEIVLHAAAHVALQGNHGIAAAFGGAGLPRQHDQIASG